MIQVTYFSPNQLCIILEDINWDFYTTMQNQLLSQLFFPLQNQTMEQSSRICMWLMQQVSNILNYCYAIYSTVCIILMIEVFCTIVYSKWSCNAHHPDHIYMGSNIIILVPATLSVNLVAIIAHLALVYNNVCVIAG